MEVVVIQPQALPITISINTTNTNKIECSSMMREATERGGEGEGP